MGGRPGLPAEFPVLLLVVALTMNAIHSRFRLRMRNVLAVNLTAEY